MEEPTMMELVEEMEVISAYSRAQALEDGVLVDITGEAEEAGFRYPVAVTRGVWGVLEPSDPLKAMGQDLRGRTWDMLMVLRHAIRQGVRMDEVHFAPLFVLKPDWKAEAVEMWSKCGPGDEGEPVITVMLRGEN